MRKKDVCVVSQVAWRLQLFLQAAHFGETPPFYGAWLRWISDKPATEEFVQGIPALPLMVWLRRSDLVAAGR